MSVRLLSMLLLVFIVFPAEAASDISKFSNHNKYRSVKISPTGKYLAISRYLNNESELLIVDSKTMKAVNQISFKKRDEVGSIYWANDTRLVIKIFAKNRYTEYPVFYGELFSIDAEDDRGKLIFGQRVLRQRARGVKQKKIQENHKAMASSWASIVGILPNDDEHILIDAKPYSEYQNKTSRLYKLNIYDGNIEFVVEAPLSGAGFITDRNGNLLLAIGRSNKDEKVVFEYNKENNDWKEIQHFPYGEAFVPLTYTQHSNSLIAIDNIDYDTSSLFSLDLKTGKKKQLFHEPGKDISWVHLTGDQQRIYGITTESGYPEYHFPDVNIEEQNVYKRLIDGFNGSRVTITSNTKDYNQFVVSVTDDRNPGEWYLYDKEKDEVTYIAKRNNHIKPDKMLPMYSIEFAARDGKQISGFITLPAIEKKEQLPAVVLVHGGPFGVSDKWGYDHEVQLLASKGYLVLQVNYRGSGGYGTEYMAAGYQHWGDLIQQDILDGVQYLISQNIIDTERVCIMGGSFGAYSAIQASLLAPKQFKCAIAASGVYDLESLFEKGDIIKRLWGKSFFDKTLGLDKKKLKLFSPINYIHKLQTPVLLVHGDQDKRTPISFAEDLEDELDDLNKTYIWMEMDNEGHGIYNEANRLKYYQQVIEFLSKYNPAN